MTDWTEYFQRCAINAWLNGWTRSGQAGLPSHAHAVVYGCFPTLFTWTGAPLFVEKSARRS